MVKTSVIIPVYNTSPYLEECISSVFNQTQKELEVIAVNDGSTDDSLDVLYQLKERYPDLIIISQENQGLGYTRNVGMKRATGEYVLFLDSDDFIRQDTLERCYEQASLNDLEILFFDAYNFDDSEERLPVNPNVDDRHNIITERNEIFTGKFYLEKYLLQTYEPSACFLYLSGLFLNKHSVQFLSRVYFEDNEFYCRIMSLAERIMYIPEMFYQRRCRDASIMGTEFGIRKANDHIEVIRAIAKLRNVNDGKAWNSVRKIAVSLLQYVVRQIQNNDLSKMDSELPGKVIDCYLQICDKDIDELTIADIRVLRQISTFLPKDSLTEEKQEIEKRYEVVLKEQYEEIPLKDKRTFVYIYGCGKYTEKWLEEYKRLIGNIESKIAFLDSYIEGKGKKYSGYDVYNVSELKEKKVDWILVSSVQYEREMREKIKELYGEEYKVLSLYGELQIEVDW